MSGDPRSYLIAFFNGEYEIPDPPLDLIRAEIGPNAEALVRKRWEAKKTEREMRRIHRIYNQHLQNYMAQSFRGMSR